MKMDVFGFELIAKSNKLGTSKIPYNSLSLTETDYALMAFFSNSCVHYRWNPLDTCPGYRMCVIYGYGGQQPYQCIQFACTSPVGGKC